MMTIVGPVLICLGLIGLIYGVYMLMFANRDTRTARQKNLDSIAEMRGDKKKLQKAVKKAKPAKR